jgi:putative ABC transport system permease protein
MSASQDLRFALRALRKSPGFAVAAIGILTLGIGASTAIFSVANAAFLRDLPYKDPGRIVWLTEFYPKFNQSMVLMPEYAAWRRQSTAFDRLEAFGIPVGMNLTGVNQPAQRVQAGHVTPGFFKLLGVPWQLGRSFSEEENEARVVVISDALWRDYFHADPSILGKSVVLDGTPRTVIGVMPAGFLYPGAVDASVWLPDAVNAAGSIPQRGMGLVSVIGRLKSGVTLEEARANLEVVARRMDSQYPTPWSRYHAAAGVRAVSLRQQLTSDARTALYVLLGSVGFILLIVCANVANLFLTRAMTRGKEIAVRAALGATRGRLIRLLLVESLLFGTLAGALGLALTYAGTSVLGFLMPRALPGTVSVDWRVFGFAAVCSMAASLLFGLMPALSASRFDLQTSLKDVHAANRRGGAGVRRVLATAQLALALVLLIGAGLLMRSFIAVLSVNPGFDAHNVLLGDVSLAPIEMYTAPRQVAFFDRALAAVRALPGVVYAGLSSSTPLVPFNEIAGGLRPEGGPQSGTAVVLTSANGDYFRALRIPLAEGRYFNKNDRAGAEPAAIVNRTLARILFPGRDPLGRHIRVGEGPVSWLTVVGVVEDIRHRALDQKVWPELFRPYQQAPNRWMSLVIRGSADPSGLIPAIRGAVQAADRSQPLFNIGSMEDRVSASVAERRARVFLLGAFALAAFAIAVIGVYGVIAYSATRRTHEIGVRMALGAQRRDVLKLVVTEGFQMALAGAAIGLAGALALTRVLSSFLYRVAPTDAATFIGLCAGLIATACLASYIPARRATKVDPVTALHHE